MFTRQPNSGLVSAVRSIRRMVVTACVVASAGGTFFLIYEFGFAVHPRRIGVACILAATYLAWCGAGLWLMHRGWARHDTKG